MNLNEQIQKIFCKEFDEEIRNKMKKEFPKIEELENNKEILKYWTNIFKNSKTLTNEQKDLIEKDPMIKFFIVLMNHFQYILYMKILYEKLIDKILSKKKGKIYMKERKGKHEISNRYISDDIKGFVWRRDNGCCVVCGSRKNIEYDHIIPINKGGSNNPGNIQILYQKHNRQKRDFINAGFVISKTLEDYI